MTRDQYLTELREQTIDWVCGESRHFCHHPKGDCCPDFSCCHPELRVDFDTRVRFLQADLEGDRKAVSSFLSMFLGAMLNFKGVDNSTLVVDGASELAEEH